MPLVDEFREQIRGNRQAAQGIVAGQPEDAKPEDAARALELGKATGIHPELIYPNIPEFEQQHKAVLNSDLIAADPNLQDYFNSNSMAAKLSHDDVGALAKASTAMTDYVKHVPSNFFQHIVDFYKSGAQALHGMMQPPEAFLKGFGEPGRAEVESGEFAQHPIPASAAAAVETAVGALSGATIYAATSVAGEKYGEQLAAALGDPGLGMTMHGMLDSYGPHGMMAAGVLSFLSKYKPARSTLNVIHDYAKEGKFPPLGVDPAIDKAYADQAKDSGKAFDTVVKALAASATNERNAEFTGTNFAKKALGDSVIAIDPDAITRLYGGAEPEVDDAKLGWIPNLRERLPGAVASGNKIEVPAWQFAPKMAEDPELYDALKEDILVRKHGFTLTEAAEQGEAKAPKAQEAEPAKPVEGEAEGPVNLDRNPGSTTLPGPLQIVRGAAGHEPMAAVGDRKLTLEKKPTATTGDVIAPDAFKILDQDGQEVGAIKATPFDGGKRVYIDDISGLAEKGYHPNTFGPALTRSLILQLKQAYPNLEQIGGFRVSGARGKAFGPAEVWVKADEADPGAYRQVRDILSQWHKVYEGGGAEVHALFGDAPTSRLGQLVTDVIRSMAPEGTRVMAAEGVAIGDKEVMGAFTRGRVKQIIVALANNEDPFTTGRHEAIHALREAGLFTEKEWSTLVSAALENKWFDRYKIQERYAHLDENGKLEEAIAEAFGEWGKGQLQVGGLTAFEKIQQFIEKLIAKIGEHLGITAASTTDMAKAIFEQIQSGEIKARDIADHDAFMRELQEDIDDGPAANRPANDVDAFQRELAKNYTTARDAQIIERALKADPNAIVKSWDAWNKIAIDENITAPLNNRPSGIAAARKYSEGGKTTLVIGFDGRRTLYRDGQKIVRELNASVVEPKAQRKGPPEGTGPDEIKIRPPFMDGKPLSTSKRIYEQYLRLIQRGIDADLDRQYSKSWDKENRVQTKEWKEATALVQEQVEKEIDQKPNVLIDQLLSQRGGNLKIDPTSVREDLLELLPKDYTRRTNSISADDLAGYFGYPSGDAMVAHLAQLSQDRVASGLNAADFRAKLIKDEVSRRMEAQFGFLEKNKIEAAKEHALSQIKIDILNAETMLIAWKHGVNLGEDATPMGYATLVQGLRESFVKTPLGSISSDAHLRAAGLAGKRAHDALVLGDFQTAIREKQRQTNATLYGKWALEAEKIKATMDGWGKRFGKITPENMRQSTVEPEFLNHIQDLLYKVGYSGARSWENVKENIARQREKTLEAFINYHYNTSQGMRDMVGADFLMDPKFQKDLNALPYEQAKELHDTIKSLIKNGTDIQSFGRAAEKTLLANAQATARSLVQVGREKPVVYGKEGEPGWVRSHVAGLTAVPTILNYMDRGNRRGFFHQLTYRIFEGVNGAASMEREVTKAWKETWAKVDLSKKIALPTGLLPRWDANYTGFTMENALGLIANIGNKSNWDKITFGWGVRDRAGQEALEKWLPTVVPREHWEAAQKFGDNVWGMLVHEGDKVQERTNGSTIDKIPLAPREVKFNDGKPPLTLKGWYHKLIPDPVWYDETNKRFGFNDAFTNHIATSDGWTRKRIEGMSYPIDLGFGRLPGVMSQMIWDINMREVIMDAQKILLHKPFLNDMTRYWGQEYSDLMETYLKNLSGQREIDSPNMARQGQMSEFLRGNLQIFYLGYQLTTPLKHFVTAAGMSARRGGTEFLWNWTKQLYGLRPQMGNPDAKMAMRLSEELQRRHADWTERLRGQVAKIQGEHGWRDNVAYYGSYLTSLSDMASARALFITEFYRALREEPTKLREAIDVGNDAVRTQHGSMSMANKPELVRLGSRWYTTFYNFMGERMQRLIESGWRNSETWDALERKQWDTFSKNAGENLKDYAAYVFMVGAGAEVSNYFLTDDRRTGWQKLFNLFLGNALESDPYARDAYRIFQGGSNVELGLQTSAARDLLASVKDVADVFKRGGVDRKHTGKMVRNAVNTGMLLRGIPIKPVGNLAGYTVDYLNHVQPGPDPTDLKQMYRIYARGQAKPPKGTKK